MMMMSKVVNGHCADCGSNCFDEYNDNMQDEDDQDEEDDDDDM